MSARGMMGMRAERKEPQTIHQDPCTRSFEHSTGSHLKTPLAALMVSIRSLSLPVNAKEMDNFTELTYPATARPRSVASVLGDWFMSDMPVTI